MLMEVLASVTVSIAALTIGICNEIFRVSWVLTFTSLGKTAEKHGSSSTSSNEYASSSNKFVISSSGQLSVLWGHIISTGHAAPAHATLPFEAADTEYIRIE
jgi:hypothetical protein